MSKEHKVSQVIRVILAWLALSVPAGLLAALVLRVGKGPLAPPGPRARPASQAHPVHQDPPVRPVRSAPRALADLPEVRDQWVRWESQAHRVQQERQARREMWE